MSTITATTWLHRWLPLLRERAGASPILELGCGSGADTAILIDAGHSVIALDLSASEISKARNIAPSADFYCQDIRENFPATAQQLGAVIASLSLHYFSWHQTLILVENIHAALRPGGVLLCRVNSTNDHNYGASGHPKIADNYYSVDGEPKRFFDANTLRALFEEHWLIRSMEEMAIYKYAKPKFIWEIVVEKC